jgi:flagellar basal-body rod modification protein FlgD
VTTTSATSNPASALYSALNGTASTTKTASTNETESRFLKLLTAQMKNQDPLNPMDNAQMTSQMAQISTVDGIERLNATLQSLITDSSNSQALQAAGLVGKGVLVPGNSVDLQNGSAFAGVDLSKDADAVTVNITDANGLLVRTLNLGATKAGSHTFAWDGKANDGTAAAEGQYTFTAVANQGADKVDTTALALGLVSSVTRSSSGGFSLNVGQQSFGMSDVRQII